MEQKKKKQEDVLVVRDEKTGEISVVAGLDARGYPKRAQAKAEHSQEFLRFDRHGDAIDNFMRNFYRQCKEPTRFGFYRVAADTVEALLPVIKDLLKDPVANADLLAPHKVDTSAYQQAEEQQTTEEAKTENAETETEEQQDTEEEKRETAETEAKEFLQVIENSASYQCGFNHATGYSILSYYCAYYRYYYTHEFVTALLNTADTQEKIVNATKLANERGIQIMPIKFRHSRDEYVYDKTAPKIYQGMESIKYLNKRLSREFYKLRNHKFDSFIDLLLMNQKRKIADSRQLGILIELDFFSEFGNPNQLLEQVDIFINFLDAIFFFLFVFV